MEDLMLVWNELKNYDGTASKALQLEQCRVKFYKGAMEIPLIAFQPAQPFNLNAEKMDGFSKQIAPLNLEIDCVEEGSNYKINKIEDQQYVGRVTREALKLHAERTKELGSEVFNKIVSYFFSTENK